MISQKIKKVNPFIKSPHCRAGQKTFLAKHDNFLSAKNTVENIDLLSASDWL